MRVDSFAVMMTAFNRHDLSVVSVTAPARHAAWDRQWIGAPPKRDAVAWFYWLNPFVQVEHAGSTLTRRGLAG
jgi:hypothetical protein